eukprot:11781974-Heterocapsa_arctica.AAC.1
MGEMMVAMSLEGGLNEWYKTAVETARFYKERAITLLGSPRSRSRDSGSLLTRKCKQKSSCGWPRS